MKKLLFLILLLPMLASAQLDFESNKYKLDFVKLPKVESLLTYSLTSDANFLTKYSNKLPSFKMNKDNYRQPVSMFEAVANSENDPKSNIQISIDPREYGVYGGNSTYSADQSTRVRNTVYEDASQPFLFTNPYYRRPYRTSGFGIYAGYYPYRYNRGY